MEAKIIKLVPKKKTNYLLYEILCFFGCIIGVFIIAYFYNKHSTVMFGLSIAVTVVCGLFLIYFAYRGLAEIAENKIKDEGMSEQEAYGETFDW